MKIGVISDTHGYLDPQIFLLFAEVEHILHAGDIGSPMIIMELESIAPVTAVLGNNDNGLDFKETELIELAGRKFLIHHIVDIHKLSDTAKRRITRDKPDVVVFGHSHKRFDAIMDCRRFFNPGYAGKPRFKQPRSAAILHCGEKDIRAEFLDL